MNALLKSREYVRGNWGALLWRFVFMALIIVTFLLIILAPFFLALFPQRLFYLNFLPPYVLTIVHILTTVMFLIIGIIGFIIFTSLAQIYNFLIYKNLKEIKGKMDFKPTKKKKALFFGIAIVGPIVAVALAAYLFLSILGSIFSGLGNNKPFLPNYNSQTNTSQERPLSLDDVSKWVTYRDEEFGFEIKHPSDVKVDKIKKDKYFEGGVDPIVSYSFKTDYRTPEGNLGDNNIYPLYISIEPTIRTMEDLKKQNFSEKSDSYPCKQGEGCDVPIRRLEKEIMVGGERAFQVSIGDNGTEYVYLVHNKKLYIFSGFHDWISSDRSSRTSWNMFSTLKFF